MGDVSVVGSPFYCSFTGVADPLFPSITVKPKHLAEVTIPNVKDAVNVFDRANCLVDGLSVPAALQAPFEEQSRILL